MCYALTYGSDIPHKQAIIPFLDLKKINEKIEFITSVDNRNIKVGDLRNLENYLKTEFCLENFDFKITYYNSEFNYGIQLADVIVNTFYNMYKDRKIVKNVISSLRKDKYRISLFPGYKIKGRTDKIE